MRHLTLLLFAGLLASAAFANWLIPQIATDCTWTFPVSILSLQYNADGLWWAALFLVMLGVVVKVRHGLGAWQAWLVGLALIVCGNMIQGGFDRAFVMPMVGARGPEYSDSAKPLPRQYMHAAATIAAPGVFLRTFNEAQPSMVGRPAFCHVRTHPPFTTLLHYALGRHVGVAWTAVIFTVLASLMVPAMWLVASTLGVKAQTATWFALLFALMPCVNIYALPSVDAVMALLAVVVLLAVVKLDMDGDRRWTWPLVGALLALNALQFAGLIVVAWLGWLAIRRPRLRPAFGWSALAGCAALGLLAGCGYNHVQAALAAHATEQLIGPHNPWQFWLTRLECVGELVLMVSPVVVAACITAPKSAARRYALPMLALVAAALAGGMWQTGEIARSGLFLIPAMVLPMVWTNEGKRDAILLAVGVQACAMQLFGCWFF